MNSVLGSIYDEVCGSANVFHSDALGANGFDESLTLVAGMRPPGLIKATRQHFIGSFKKKYEDVEALVTKRAELLFKLGEKLSLSHVHDERGPLDSRFLLFA